MSGPRPLDRLATLAGIEPAYHDIWGAAHHLSDDTKRTLLAAMGFAIDNDDLIAASLAHLEASPWRRALGPVQVLVAGANTAIALRLVADRIDRPLEWRLSLEDGGVLSGSVTPGDLPCVETHQLDGHMLERRMLTLSASLPPGYHRLAVSGEGLAGAPHDETDLIVAPARAYWPDWLDQGPGCWGFATQIYALQGRESWGMGDFGDLARFAAKTAELGASLVGVNPLHALFPGNPAQASPYSPSSRRFLNPLYIDTAAVPDLADCPGLEDELGGDLAALRQSSEVDYERVTTLKFGAFERLFKSFLWRHLVAGGPRAEAFRSFQRRGGKTLEGFARFAALDEHFRAGRHGFFPWRDWPDAYRHPDSAEVTAFAEAHDARLTFYQYLQWEADRQLGLAAEAGRDAGMKVGLYRDLAVGIDAHGAEAWADQDAFALGISTGAPPDAFNLKGQSWGLPPFRPHALKAQAYRPFIESLRANMRHAGALRIDHVMGLMRLYWVPQAADATAGGYVRYPLDDLIAITALESQRARCVVVGEDLGTVPDGLRERFAAVNILSTRLLYFERDGGTFRPGSDYPKLAQVAIGSQDLPPFAGFWNGHDIALRLALALLPTPESEAELYADRATARNGILALLRDAGLLPPEGDHDIPALAAAAYRFLAATPSRLVMVYLEDVLGVEDQINLPGTVDQHPNWRIKLPRDWRTLLADERVARLARWLAEARPR